MSLKIPAPLQRWRLLLGEAAQQSLGGLDGEIASAEAVDTIYGMIKRGLPDLGDEEEPLTDEKVSRARRITSRQGNAGLTITMSAPSCRSSSISRIASSPCDTAIW